MGHPPGPYMTTELTEPLRRENDIHGAALHADDYVARDDIGGKGKEDYGLE